MIETTKGRALILRTCERGGVSYDPHIDRLADAAAIWCEAMDALNRLGCQYVVINGRECDIEDIHPDDMRRACSIDLAATREANRRHLEGE